MLTRSHLAELGLGRSAVDAIFRELDVVVFPGSSRPHVCVADYLALSSGRVRQRPRPADDPMSAYTPRAGARRSAPTGPR